MRRSFYIVLFITALLTTPLHAAEDGVREHFERGVTLYEAGKFTAARFEFDNARKAMGSDRGGRLTDIDYYDAMCAVELDEPAAMRKLEIFLSHNPNSLYYHDVRFAIAKIYYDRGEYEKAHQELMSMNAGDMSGVRRSEYNFMLGHTYFMMKDYDHAYEYMQLVEEESPFGAHALYYISYINYDRGNYGAAKDGFYKLMENDSYVEVMKYYILQIEFLQGNYRYVVDNGEGLIAGATKQRAVEIARVVGESHYRLGEYAAALRLMERFEEMGGVRGREELYIVGYSHHMLGDHALSAEVLARVVDVDDNLAQNASYHMGLSYLLLGNKRSALKSFSEAVATGTDEKVREEALFNYAKLRYETGAGEVFDEAIKSLTRFVNDYPSSARIDQAREYLISAYYNTGNYAEAYEAIKLFPNPDNNMKSALQKIAYFRALEYYEAGDYEVAHNLLEQSSEYNFSQKYTALTMFWKGELLYRRGETEEAISYFKDYIRMSPPAEREYRMAEYNLGYCYFNRHEWREAGEWFSRFLSDYNTFDSYRADAFNRMGDVEFAQRAFTRAADNYSKAIQIDTRERYYAEYQGAVMQGLMGRAPRKIELLEDIIAGAGGDYMDDALYELGRTYIGQSKFRDAATAMKRYTSQYPKGDKYLDALSDLGLIYQNLGEGREALGYYKQVVEKGPRSQQANDAMHGIRGIYVDMNDVDSYFAYARRAGVETDLGVVQKDSLTYAAASAIYLAGDDKRSADAMQGYLDGYPRGNYRAEALYYLGESASRAGDRARAVEAFDNLAGMYNNDFTVRGLQRLAKLRDDAGDYAAAADAYKRLSETATQSGDIIAALKGYLNAAVRQGDDQKMLTVANEVLSSPDTDRELGRKARFYKAKGLDATDKYSQAIRIYRELSQEVFSAEGAESAFRVIEDHYNKGELDEAEQAVFALSDKNSPQTYWVGRAFLVLGDVYLRRGDSFQAKATFQSIVDGYTPADDGIVSEARAKIGSL